ncbi:hypothetical protein RvY_11501 [Ramazzottius varieornatus]|uniref:Uncharacterized protein n=1 Tax=Ramazzottius varieornatus TaxID=947166 RepID=A0A1D1VGA7_RAMVA|nr:hypothetical protein RvY_11501 [Ramazzottius varieornatus]
MDYRCITLSGSTGHPAAYRSSGDYGQQSQVNSNYGFLDALGGFAGNYSTNTFSPALENFQPSE